MKAKTRLSTAVIAQIHSSNHTSMRRTNFHQPQSSNSNAEHHGTWLRPGTHRCHRTLHTSQRATKHNGAHIATKQRVWVQAAVRRPNPHLATHLQLKLRCHPAHTLLVTWNMYPPCPLTYPQQPLPYFALYTSPREEQARACSKPSLAIPKHTFHPFFIMPKPVTFISKRSRPCMQPTPNPRAAGSSCPVTSNRSNTSKEGSADGALRRRYCLFECTRHSNQCVSWRNVRQMILAIPRDGLQPGRHDGGPVLHQAKVLWSTVAAYADCSARNQC